MEIIRGAAALLAVVCIAGAAETITMDSTVKREITGQEHCFTNAEIDMMAKVAQAEYGNGTEKDKRLVVSVILNRLESDLPDFRKQNTVEVVCTAKNQFATADYYTLETLNAVYREIADRTDDRVLWFSSTGYQPYGEPLFELNGHYFSGE